MPLVGVMLAMKHYFDAHHSGAETLDKVGPELLQRSEPAWLPPNRSGRVIRPVPDVFGLHTARVSFPGLANLRARVAPSGCQFQQMHLNSGSCPMRAPRRPVHSTLTQFVGA